MYKRQTLSWKKATDNAYEDNELVYYVYRCKEDGNEDDVRGMEALSDPTRAILQNPGGSKDIDTLDISGLTPGKLYWYNIVVEDPAGNKTSYSMASAYAREPVKYKVEVIISGGGSVSPASCEVNEMCIRDRNRRTPMMFWRSKRRTVFPPSGGRMCSLSMPSR